MADGKTARTLAERGKYIRGDALIPRLIVTAGIVAPEPCGEERIVE